MTPKQEQNEELLSVDNLSVQFKVGDRSIKALRDVSLMVNKGEILGIAGESGSGKSTLALAIVQYLDSNATVESGTIDFNGENLLDFSTRELRSIRGNQIAHVAQNPSQALNPSMRIGKQIREAIMLHQDVSKKEATEQMYETLGQVNIPSPKESAKRYPSELSGGQQQRALIAIGLSCNPELLILDEPTSGLDVTTQGKLLDLIEDLKRESDAGILLITHNLGVLSRVTDRVNILYAGEMMEKGTTDEVFAQPANPYTQALLASTPEMGQRKDLRPIPGQIPDLNTIPNGCIFADRCAFATEECHSESITMESVSSTHQTRCQRWKTAVKDPIETETKPQRHKEVGDAIVEAEGLTKHYDEGTFVQKLLRDHKPVQAVQNVDLTVRENETVGIVGESGCGKSTLGRTLLRLHEATSGGIRFRGDDISSLSKERLKKFHSECQIIFQDPESSLNPRKSVYEIIERPMLLYTDLDEEQRISKVESLLSRVNLSRDLKENHPHELSGGQQQRVAIARAFAADPALVVLDEPVSSLDVSVQASILNLLDDLQKEYNTSYLLISHDMGVVENICDRLAVMYLGKIVERGSTDEIFNPPYHPYTRSLLSNIPSLDPQAPDTRVRLEGDVPNARNPPSGCSFHTRCPQKIGPTCTQSEPNLESIGSSGSNSPGSGCIACHLDTESMSVPLEEMEGGD